MIELVVDNSICKLNSLSIELYRALRQVLSYKIPAQERFFSGGHRDPNRYLINKKCEFPTGLLYLVTEFLESSGIEYKLIDKRRRPRSLNELFTLNLSFQPYPEQVEAALACYQEGRGIVSAPTGLGKSLICALIIYNLKVKTLVVVPSLELKRQLTETLKSCFGENKVGPLRDQRDIAVENIDALDPGHEITTYDCVIIDEFHHAGADSYLELNKRAWNKVFYKFGVTATPFRSQDHERLLLEGVLSKVIYQIEYKSAVEKGYIVPLEAYYIDLPKKKVEGRRWPEVYSELVVRNEERNKIIAQLLRNLHSSGVSTLCLVKEVAHGKTLSSLTGGAFMHGNSEERDWLLSVFNARQLKTLIGTSGVVGEGVDTKPAEFVVIAGLGKSKNQFMQQCGRGFRVYAGKATCKIVIFRDPSHKWSIAHFRAQCKVLEDEYGIKPVKLKGLT